MPSIAPQNALLVRKREKRLAQRELARAKEANLPDGQARLQAAKVGLLARIAGTRLAAQLPNLIEDPWLPLKAEVYGCTKMISYFEQRRQAASDKLEKMRQPSGFEYRYLKQSDPST